jgi:hypothetical protein
MTFLRRQPFLKGLALVAFGLAAAGAHAQGRFSISANGQEVGDASSHLTWRRCVEGQRWDGKTCSGTVLKFTYAEAKRRARAAAQAGAPAWRLPTRDELVGLVDRKLKGKPKIDLDAFPKTPTTPQWATRPGSDDDLNAWLVSFGNGKVTGNAGMARFPLRLVR